MIYPHARYLAALPGELAVHRTPLRVEPVGDHFQIVLDCGHRIPTGDEALAQEAVRCAEALCAKLRCPACEAVEAQATPGS